MAGFTAVIPSSGAPNGLALATAHGLARCDAARADVAPGMVRLGSFFLFLVVGGSVHSRHITTAILALASVVFVAACDDDDDDPVSPGPDNATVRFFNATTGGLSID